MSDKKINMDKVIDRIEEGRLEGRPMDQLDRRIVMSKVGQLSIEEVKRNVPLFQAMQQMVAEDLARAESAVLLQDEIGTSIRLELIDPNEWRLSYRNSSILFNEVLRVITSSWHQNDFGAWNKSKEKSCP